MDEKCVDEFLYDPIDNPATVRLLQVSRGEGASIIGKLENFSLDALPITRFTTLSYVWGQKAYHPNKIILNRQPFPILESLYPALEAICDNLELVNENLWWWIDSICINQKNDREAKSERSSQIQLMGRIYKQSKRTVVWLGEGTKDSDDAIEFLHILARSKNRLNWKNRMKWEVEIQKLLDSAKWKPLESLLLRPWWRRVWTLQEFIIAPKLTFYCGSKSIGRGRLGAAICSLDRCRKSDDHLIKLEAFISAWNRRRLIRWHEYGNGSTNRMGLIALMAYVGDCQATDGRDRIYSLLGLAKDRELAGLPDYESSVNKIYSKLVQSFIDTYKSLDIICFADLFNKHRVKSDTHRILPSWVPDWRADVVPFVVPLMASQSAGTHIGNFRPSLNPPMPGRCATTLYAAAGTSLPEITFSDDFRILTCKAILINHIDGLGGIEADSQGCIQSTSLINGRITMEADIESVRSIQIGSDLDSTLMEDIARTLVLDREDPYLSYPAPIERFRREFQDLCVIAVEKPKEAHSWFRDWFELNKYLCIRGRTLETLCRIAKVPIPSNMTNFITTSRTSFVSRLHDTSGEIRMARRFVTTNDGYIGMTPYRAKKGDLICVLLGCSIPVVLRKREHERSEGFIGESYEFIGECYLHGFMNGEAQDCGKFEIKDFRLS